MQRSRHSHNRETFIQLKEFIHVSNNRIICLRICWRRSSNPIPRTKRAWRASLLRMEQESREGKTRTSWQRNKDRTSRWTYRVRSRTYWIICHWRQVARSSGWNYKVHSAGGCASLGTDRRQNWNGNQHRSLCRTAWSNDELAYYWSGELSWYIELTLSMS